MPCQLKPTPRSVVSLVHDETYRLVVAAEVWSGAGSGAVCQLKFAAFIAEGVFAAPSRYF